MARAIQTYGGSEAPARLAHEFGVTGAGKLATSLSV